jgi:hypothetical protein
VPPFALRCTDFNRKRLIRDLVENLGIAEIGRMGVSLEPAELKRFLEDVRCEDDRRRRRSQKR